jgi:phage-related tail fiber protein
MKKILFIIGILMTIYSNILADTEWTTAVGDDGNYENMMDVWADLETPPAGYLEAAGQAVSREDYPALFSLFQVQYGVGNELTTFDLPDLRGEFLGGLDHGRNVDINRTLGSNQSDAFKTHQHKYKL